MSDQLELIEADKALKPVIHYLAIGRDADLEAQLIKKSQEPNILQYTPNDAKARFGDPAMLEQWLSQGREIHWLLGANHDLAGIMWYGRKPFPLDATALELAEAPQDTFAIRLYDGYTGQGLARPFVTQSHRLWLRNKHDRGEAITGLWLQTDLDNAAAAAVYTKFGYREVARDDHRITMLLSAAELTELLRAHN